MPATRRIKNEPSGLSWASQINQELVRFLTRVQKNRRFCYLVVPRDLVSTRYGAALKLAPGDKGLNLLVGDAKSPGKDLQAALRVHLKVKDNGQFFGHKAVLYLSRAGASANKDGI